LKLITVYGEGVFEIESDRGYLILKNEVVNIPSLLKGFGGIVPPDAHVGAVAELMWIHRIPYAIVTSLEG
jgi:hypothetical protein